MEANAISSLINIPELNRSNVFIGDPVKICNKLKQMKAGAKDCLQAVLDFDKTMTQSHVYDLPALGTFEILTGFCGDSFKSQIKKILPSCIKAVTDVSLSIEEKSTSVENALKIMETSLHQIKISDDEPIIKEAYKGKFKLKEGIDKGFNLMKENGVPVTILSAGLGDGIEAIMKVNGIWSNNISVFANYFVYKDDHVEKFKSDIIHLYNKSRYYLTSEAYKHISKRSNIIVIGDSISDTTMVDGVPDTCNILKIGFYYKYEHAEDIEQFKKVFDIVLTSDETMDVINAILQYILE